MSIERITCNDWSGGQVPRLAAHQFSERQWASLSGVVIEDQARVRSQWPVQQVGTAEDGFDQLGVLQGQLIARKPDGSFWWAPYTGSFEDYVTTNATAWTKITDVTADPELYIVCNLPAPTGESLVGFREGLLLNGVDRDDDAYVLYFAGGDLHVLDYPKWPDPDDSDAKFIPPASVGAMWGDFLVLGDIMWLRNESDPLDDDNYRRHNDGIWYSDPVDVGKWDILDVEWVKTYDSVGSGSLAITELRQIDAGLLVFTHSGTVLLRGSGDDHVFESLRPGVGSSRRGATYWSISGSVCWIDRGGRVWSTNGEEFARLNEGTALEADTDVAVSLCGSVENLLVSYSDGRLLYLRALEDEGVWGELLVPGNTVKNLVATGTVVYWIGDGGKVWRFTLSTSASNERGLVDGQEQNLRIATRTIARGGGHQKTFFHRVGLRAKGPGKLRSVTLRPGPALDPAQPTLVHEFDDVGVGHREEIVVRGHGPSVEGSAEVVFRGDVQVEGVTFYFHEGKGSR